MAKLSIVAGATSQSVTIFVQNSSSTTGAGLTGLVFNTSGLIAYYTFSGANATATAITLATLATVTTAYSSGGFIEIDSTHMPGAYRLDLPNAVLATSKGRSVVVYLSGATNMAPCVLEIELTGWDNQDGVRGGMTALPNAAAAASGGLIINGSNTGTVTLAALTVSGATTWTGNVAMQAGLTITQSTTNGHGISVTGNGTGNGILSTSGSGATGDGFKAVSAATNGNGLTATATGTGKDLNSQTTNSLQVNATAINAVATTSVTTINANIGETQPINFTGTGASALVKSDATDIGGTAAGSATIGTVTNVTNGVTVTTNNDKTGYTVSTNNDKTGYTLSNAGIDAVFTRTLGTEAYATNGSVPTFAQMMFMLWAATTEFSISGTTITSQKLDGVTAAMTWTLNDGTNPTSRVRAT